jgi:BlaI family penicillinase repressor
MKGSDVRISGAESKIMEALWERGLLTVADIIADVADAQQWSDATVKSLIGRMLKKNAIRSTRENGRTLYKAMISRDDYIRSESRGFLDRLFGGELSPFVSHFSEHQALSKGDIVKLKALLERLEDGD